MHVADNTQKKGKETSIMANVKKANRVQDTDIKRLNHVGLGLKTIADQLGCHAATITLRLKAMGIEPTDTRRSFMEAVFTSLSPAEQDWLSHNLFNSGIGIKEFVATLIKEAFNNAPAVATAAPVAMPVMQTVVAPTPVPVAEPLKVEETPDAELKVTPEKVIEPVAETASEVPATPPKSLFS
jgi:hypothetical protein